MSDRWEALRPQGSRGSGKGGGRAAGSDAAASPSITPGPEKLAQLVERWQSGYHAGSQQELWSAVRAALRGAERRRSGQKEEEPEALAQLIWEALDAFSPARPAGSGQRERPSAPADVADSITALCCRALAGGGGEKDPASWEGLPSLLRLLAHALPDAGLKGDDADALPRRLAALLRRSSASLRVSSLVLICFGRLAERSAAAVRGAAKEAAEGFLAAAQCVGEHLLHGRASTPSALRDAQQLLHALPPLLPEVKQALEPSALTLLASLQPCAVAGAPYVLRSRQGVDGGYPPGLGSCSPSHLASETERSEVDTGGSGSGSDAAVVAAVARRRGRGRGGEGEETATALAMLAAQCRAAALRGFAQLFKLFPKAFFGRWPLVLDFQRGDLLRGAGGGQGAQLPTLLTLCKQDPATKVRAAGLVALCALLEAPSVRTWPVPLEREAGAGAGASGGGSSSSSAAPAFTSFAGQVAMTLRQSHTLVFGLLRSRASGDVQSALHACGDILGCTPYTKLRPGLLSEAVNVLLPFLRGMNTLESLDNLPQNVSLSMVALHAALKREDCAEELGRCLFSAPAAGQLGRKPSLGGGGGSLLPGVPLADELLGLGCHVLRLAGLSAPPAGAAQQASAAATATPSTVLPSPSAAGRRGRGSRGAATPTGPDGLEVSASAAAVDPEGGAQHPVALDFAALVGRLAPVRQSPMATSTSGLFQSFIEDLLEQSGSGLRMRGCKVLEDLLPARHSAGPAELPGAWCAGVAHRLLAALPTEPVPGARAALLTALPGTALAALRSEGESAAAALRPHVLAVLRSGSADAATIVRVAAAQSSGFLTELWLGSPEAAALRGGRSAFELLLALFSDASADVRAAAATAVASFATAAAAAAEPGSSSDSGDGGTGGPSLRPPPAWPWRAALEGVLALCRDRSDKARAAAIRCVGVLVEAHDVGLDGPDEEGASPSVGAPPGLAAPPAEEAGVELRRPLLARLAEELAGCVRTPPAKGQWAACRAVGQLYHCGALLRCGKEGGGCAPRDAAHRSLLRALCGEAAGAANMKVRIQALQALQQIPAEPALWAPPEADAVLRALCDSLKLLAGPSAAGAPEDRSMATYTKSLRAELCSLGQHWARCAAERPGPDALKALVSSSDLLLELLREAGRDTATVRAAAAGEEEGERAAAEQKTEEAACEAMGGGLLARRLDELVPKWEEEAVESAGPA